MEKESLYEHFYDENIIYESILHDIKTPLSIMYFYIKELEECVCSADAKKSIENLKNNLNKVTNIVNITSKEISKFKLKNPEYIEKNIFEEINNIFQDTNRVLNNSTKEISIKYNLKESTLAIDPIYFDIIITNIASNSLKFAKSKVVIIISKNGKFFEIKVENDGNIKENIYEHILEPYVKTTNMNKEGSGLGLYIVQLLVKSLDGEIEINLDNEKVSTVVRLPIIKIILPT